MKRIFTVLFFLAAFAFWAFLSPYHLLYLEQNRIFEFTAGFFIKHLHYPGGPVAWFACFIGQFFVNPIVSGAIVAALLTMLQILCSRSISLPFLPPVLLWIFLCTAGNLIDPVLDLIICLAVYPASKKWKTAVLPFALSALYYVCGPVAIVLAFLWMLDLAGKKEIPAACILVCFAGALPLLASLFVQMPLQRLFFGVDINLNPGPCNPWLVAACISVVLNHVLARQIPKHGRFVVIAASLAVVVVGVAGLKQKYEKPLEIALEYDWLATHSRWDAILQLAEKQQTRSPLAVSCVNLALAETGQLGEKMFSFYQKGTAGLFPDYGDNYLQMVAAGEPLFRAGLLNMSLRYAFEAYASSPDFNESPRHLKRMAEVNLLNRQYEVAGKYLRQLSHTLFYRAWALPLLEDPSSIENMPEYSSLALCRDSEDFIFNDNGKDEMLRNILKNGAGANRTACEYLIAYDLLEKNLPALADDFALVEDSVREFPAHWQEALLFLRKIAPETDAVFASKVGETVNDDFESYRNDVFSQMSDASLRRKYGRTFWYYFVTD